MSEGCSAKVWEDSRWPSSHQCSRKAVVEREGKRYCKVHDPEYIAAKRKEHTERWERDWVKQRETGTRNALIAEAFEGIGLISLQQNADRFRAAILAVETGESK